MPRRSEAFTIAREGPSSGGCWAALGRARWKIGSAPSSPFSWAVSRPFASNSEDGAIRFGPSGAGPNDMRTHFGGGFGLVDFGYAFIHTEHVLLTLTGGIGGYGVELGIGDDQSVRFDDVLGTPGAARRWGKGACS
jgi:hypothetical protein